MIWPEILTAFALMCQCNGSISSSASQEKQKMCVAELIECIGNSSELDRYKVPEKLVKCLKK